MKLTAEEYWKWRHSIEVMKLDDLKKQNKLLQRDLMSREIENKKLKLALYRSEIAKADDAKQKSEQAYQAIKKTIEDRIEHSLDGCAIDEHTFEVITPDKLDL